MSTLQIQFSIYSYIIVIVRNLLQVFDILLIFRIFTFKFDLNLIKNI